MECDSVSELWPPTDLLFIPQMIYEYYEYGKLQWNDIDKGKLKKLEENLCQFHFIHRKSHMDSHGCKPRPPQ
jgi:hypothetical protein